MVSMKIALIMMVALSISFFVCGVFETRFRKKSLRSRLEQLDVTEEGVSLEELEMSKSFYERVLAPVLSRIGRFLGNYTPAGFLERTEKKLFKAGFHKADPLAYLGMKGLLALALAGLSSAAGLLAGGRPGSVALYPAIFLPLGFALPDLIVTSIGNRRRREVQDALPDFLDLLTVSVGAGLGFDQALSQAAGKLKGAISSEIKRMLQEMRLGKKRSEALRALSDRVALPDLKSFCAALIQADQLGVSVSDVLRVQSDSMRQKRRQRSEEAAMKAPLKMLFPLVFFIFPALFIILLGPAFISIMENFKAG